MKVSIIRHGRVLHTWKKWCTSAEFDEQCKLYDKSPIDEESIKTTSEPVHTIWISTLDRTLQTARKLFGDANYNKTNLLNEVPLCSGFDTKSKMPLWFWNVLGRIQWMLSIKRQQETRTQTKSRADRFVEKIIENNVDCAVVTHGFFMHTLIKCFKEKGFSADKIALKYDNGEIITLRN